MPHMLKQVLGSILSREESAQVYSAFDQIGDIVIIKIPDELKPKKKLIADAILANVKTAKAVFIRLTGKGRLPSPGSGVRCRRKQDDH